MKYYERRLPHFDVIGQPMFVTFCLHGSLPARRKFPPSTTSGEVFTAMDRLLDHARSGPMFLRIPDIATIVIDALQHGEHVLNRYEMHSWVVMPNHVHVLVTPKVPSREWLGPLKGFTASQSNRALGRTGKFWQDESYDHLVRGGAEFDRIRGYIESNPVRAGLAKVPEEFPWSAANTPTTSSATSSAS